MLLCSIALWIVTASSVSEVSEQHQRRQLVKAACPATAYSCATWCQALYADNHCMVCDCRLCHFCDAAQGRAKSSSLHPPPHVSSPPPRVLQPPPPAPREQTQTICTGDVFKTGCAEWCGPSNCRLCKCSQCPGCRVTIDSKPGNVPAQKWLPPPRPPPLKVYPSRPSLPPALCLTLLPNGERTQSTLYKKCRSWCSPNNCNKCDCQGCEFCHLSQSPSMPPSPPPPPPPFHVIVTTTPKPAAVTIHKAVSITNPPPPPPSPQPPPSPAPPPTFANLGGTHLILTPTAKRPPPPSPAPPPYLTPPATCPPAHAPPPKMLPRSAVGSIGPSDPILAPILARDKEASLQQPLPNTGGPTESPSSITRSSFQGSGVMLGVALIGLLGAIGGLFSWGIKYQSGRLFKSLQQSDDLSVVDDYPIDDYEDGEEADEDPHPMGEYPIVVSRMDGDASQTNENGRARSVASASGRARSTVGSMAGSQVPALD
mmetsp:Transcript_73807/g.123308  ORF Transcript_73807/g.123308 Transcript_73807/m.123308 type:complete len:484 (-) Transcript_73807:444-1895(-)